MSLRKATISAMRATATSAFTSVVDNTVFVDTVGDYFRFKAGSTLTPVSNVVVTSSDGLGQWHRMGIPNQTFLAASFWAVDPANATGLASDENAGWGATQVAADLVPLLTMAELKRRTAGARYAGTVVFHQLSGATTGEPLEVSTINANGYPVWLGSKTTLFEGALTTYTAANPAGNAGVQVSIASLPVSFTASGLVGMCIESANGLRCAMIQKDLGTKTARITQPCNPSVVGHSVGTSQVFTAGEQVRIVSFPRLPCVPFSPDGMGYYGISDVTLNSGDFAEYDFGGWNVAAARMTTAGSYISIRGRPGATGASMTCVQYGSTTVFFSGLVVSNRFCGARSAAMFAVFGASFLVSHTPMDFQASTLVIQAGSLTTYGVECDIGVFDCPGLFLSCDSGAQLGHPIRFNFAARLYGTGNVGYLIVVNRGSSTIFFPSANCYATTSAAKPILLAGVEKDYADLPVVDTANLAGIWVT